MFQGVPAFSLKNKRFGGTVWEQFLGGNKPKEQPKLMAQKHI